MLRLSKRLSIATLIAISTCGIASADFTGDEVFSTLEAPTVLPGDNLWDNVGGATTADPTSAIVGPGQEYLVTLGGDLFADIGADTIEIGLNFVGPIGDQVIFDFTSLDGGSPITAVDIANSDFTDVDIQFGDDSLTVTIPDQLIDDPRLNLNISFAGSVVPEPSSAVALAITMLGFALRRRK